MDINNFKHIPVLLNECIENLKVQKEKTYVDGTLGGAGHSYYIAKLLNNTGKLIGIDRDEEAIEVAKNKLLEFTNVIYINDNHDNIKEILNMQEVDAVDGILLDLGVSSYQIDEKKRGFSYKENTLLDMRMDQKQLLTAKLVVNTYTEEKLADIMFQYGEEKFSKRIAKNICTYRQNKEIETTEELANIVNSSLPGFSKNVPHPEKRVFQAVRIEVNNEIEPLYNAIRDSIECLKPGGRLCVITFHSLEDRAVKLAFSDAEGKCTCPKDLPYCMCNQISMGKIIAKKPILPTEEELKKNTRSGSAKLRVFERR